MQELGATERQLTRKKQRAEKGESIKRRNRPMFKHFQITHLNCNQSKTALDELTKIRARDDVLVSSEVPTRDGNPYPY